MLTRLLVLFAVTAARPSVAELPNGQELLINGGFEEELDGWRKLNLSGACTFEVDRKKRKTGKYSLRIERSAGERVDFVKQEVLLPNDKGEVQLSVAYRVEDPGHLQLDVYFIDAKGETIGEYPTVFASGPTRRKWKTAKKKLTVPEGAEELGVNIRAAAEGIAWIDVVSAVWDGPQRAEEDEIPVGVLTNGDFESGLEGWAEVETGRGRARAAIDGKVRAAGEASLRLDREAPRLWPPYAWETRVARGRERKGTLAVSVRCEGNARASVTVMALSAPGALLASEYLEWRSTGDHFERHTLSLDLPRGSQEVAISVSIEGQGAVWFDDLQWEAR